VKWQFDVDRSFTTRRFSLVGFFSHLSERYKAREEPTVKASRSLRNIFGRRTRRLHVAEKIQACAAFSAVHSRARVSSIVSRLFGSDVDT